MKKIYMLTALLFFALSGPVCAEIVRTGHGVSINIPKTWETSSPKGAGKRAPVKREVFFTASTTEGTSKLIHLVYTPKGKDTGPNQAELRESSPEALAMFAELLFAASQPYAYDNDEVAFPGKKPFEARDVGGKKVFVQRFLLREPGADAAGRTVKYIIILDDGIIEASGVCSLKAPASDYNTLETILDSIRIK